MSCYAFFINCLPFNQIYLNCSLIYYFSIVSYLWKMFAKDLTKENMRWILHARLCFENDIHCELSECRLLKYAYVHSVACASRDSCGEPLCNIIYGYVKHWNGCLDNNCRVCKDMRFATERRFNPEDEGYPRAIYMHPLSHQIRSKRIKKM